MSTPWTSGASLADLFHFIIFFYLRTKVFLPYTFSEDGCVSSQFDHGQLVIYIFPKSVISLQIHLDALCLST